MSARIVFLAGTLAMLAARVTCAAVPHSDSRSDVDEPQQRPLAAIRADVRAALRAESLSRRQGPNASDVVRLVELYRELAGPPRRDESIVIHDLGMKLRSRLARVRDRIERRSGNRERAATKDDVAVDLVVPETVVLAQQVAVQGGGPAAQGAQAVAGQPGAGQIVDYGPELVELIQQTISPGTWDINGGNGAVMYFAPFRALVVRAPATVHHQVGDVLGQLRAAP